MAHAILPTGSVTGILDNVAIPDFVPVVRTLRPPRIPDLEKATAEAIAEQVALTIAGGETIAISAGSRGIAEVDQALRAVVAAVKARGAKPFIFPAMGSHGGATAEGQRSVLTSFGITEEAVGCPIRATMETETITETADGLPVALDRHAFQADGVIVLNKVKQHVSFEGPYESGLMKMLSIGVGKQRGAQTCHSLGFGHMATRVEAIGRAMLATGRIRFGVALLENASHEPAHVEAIAADRIPDREPQLLDKARSLAPEIGIDSLDVLVIDEIGKNIAGTGFDAHVVGRYSTEFVTGGPQITRVVCLDLTDASHGNSNGLGLADVTTARLFGKIDFEQTYPNSLTSTVPVGSKIPMALPSDRRAIQAAIRMANIPDDREPRIARITNTNELGSFVVSTTVAADLPPVLEPTGSAAPLPFDADGNLR